MAIFIFVFEKQENSTDFFLNKYFTKWKKIHHKKKMLGRRGAS
jgi:hypothetical protein